MSFKKHSARVLKGLSSYRVTSEVTSYAVNSFLQSLDCPRALTAFILFNSGEHEQLAKLECNPLNYNSMVEFRDAYAATKFLSKFKDLTLNYDLDEVALSKFEKFEDRCAQTNRRFRNLSADPGYTGPVVWLHSAVIQKIESILRDFSADELFQRANWGPGATTLIKSRDASSTIKFQREVGITRDLYALLQPSSYDSIMGQRHLPFGEKSLLENAYPLWWSHLETLDFPQFQVGNKVVTVPKDATTNRVIAIEPGINLWFQKAIGEMINRRLRRSGIDLRFQDRNQLLAKKASISGLNATVDFSSASDSIASELVERLLPPRWFSLLDSCRSRFGSLGDDLRSWHKFSSMGNGYTFSLQSLIFYAMAICCMEYVQSNQGKIPGEIVSVYGDDVIVPARCLELFSDLSAFYGFLLNPSKSFSSGYFRESCGSHFWSGVDVKPYYLKGNISDVRSLYRVANSIRRLAHRRNACYGCDIKFLDLFDRLVTLVPKSFRFRIPESLGDGGFISNFDEATPQRARHGIEGYFAIHVVEESRTFQSDTIGLLLARLWVLSSTQSEQLSGARKSPGNSVSKRGQTRLSLKKSLVQQWVDLGPWI